LVVLDLYHAHYIFEKQLLETLSELAGQTRMRGGNGMEPENPFDLPWLEGDGMLSEDGEGEDGDDDDLSVDGEVEAGVEENGGEQPNAAQPAAPDPPGVVADQGPWLQNQPRLDLPKSTLARPVALATSFNLYS
jgi:hypothetical protein